MPDEQVNIAHRTQSGVAVDGLGKGGALEEKGCYTGNSQGAQYSLRFMEERYG